MMLFALGFFIALIATGYLATRQLINYAHRKQLLDIANHRSSHTKATPRIGGLSFVALITLLLAFHGFYIDSETWASFSLFILLPCLLVAIIGLLDDINGLAQSKRFIAYLACSLLALGNLSATDNHSLWLIVAVGLPLSLGLCWLINLFNFMDGIDGIAASEAIFVLAALAIFGFQADDLPFGLLLVFCTAPIIGFLLVNWQPAKIFMGDIGSTFLGCLLGCLMLYAVSHQLLSIYSCIILLGSFLADASWTLGYRMLSGQKWYHAHRSHNYQILSRKLSSHQTVTLLYTLVNLCWLLPLALLASHYPRYGLLITTISLLPLIFQCFIIGAGKSTQN